MPTYQRGIGHATKPDDIQRDHRDHTNASRDQPSRPRGQIKTDVVPGSPASHHLAWPLCGCAAAGLPDAEIFSLQFDLSMTALDILGITAEI